MRVTLVYPDAIDMLMISSRCRYSGVGKRPRPYPPLGILKVAEIASRYADVTFIDNAVLQLNNTDLFKLIFDSKPDVVGVGGTFAESPQAHAIGHACRAMGIKSVYGGANASARPQHHKRVFDHVVQGAGLLEFVHILGYGISQLDGFEAYPARHMLDLEKYDRRAPDHMRSPMDTVITSMGCPFKCRFCSSAAIWGDKYQFRDLHSVTVELAELSERYGTKSIYFRDDTVILNENRLKVIGEMMVDNDMDWMIQCRLEDLTPARLDLLLKYGCKAVSCGFESINNETLKYLGKGFTAKDVRQVIGWLDVTGTHWQGGFMVGTPNEDAEDIRHTIEFVKRHKESKYCILGKKPIMRFVGYPVSDTYYEIQKETLVYYNWHDGEFLVPNTRHLTSPEVDAVIKEAL